jgi:hypothetical protein
MFMESGGATSGMAPPAGLFAPLGFPLRLQLWHRRRNRYADWIQSIVDALANRPDLGNFREGRI